MTILQNNSKLQGHPNLFAKHRSLEKLFTYLKKKKKNHCSFANILPSTIPDHQTCSKLYVSSFFVQGILQGKKHDALSTSNLWVSSKKTLCTCLTDIAHFFCFTGLIFKQLQTALADRVLELGTQLVSLTVNLHIAGTWDTFSAGMQPCSSSDLRGSVVAYSKAKTKL